MPTKTIAHAYRSHFVLAGAYRGKDVNDRALLSHSVPVLADGGVQWDADKTLCRGVLLERMCGDEGTETNEPPTCPKCATRLAVVTAARAKLGIA